MSELHLCLFGISDIARNHPMADRGLDCINAGDA